MREATSHIIDALLSGVVYGGCPNEAVVHKAHAADLELQA
jgi:hypothetical protein